MCGPRELGEVASRLESGPVFASYRRVNHVYRPLPGKDAAYFARRSCLKADERLFAVPGDMRRQDYIFSAA